MATLGRTKVKSWLKDTGASWSSTDDKRWFKRLEPTDKYRITFGDGQQTIAAGVGEVDIVTRNQKGEEVVIELKEVLYLPDSFGNIFSSQHYIGPEYKRTGNAYYGGPDGTYIRQNNNWIKLHEKGTSAFLVPDGPQCEGYLWQAQNTDKSHISYWHEVLGHADKRVIMRMAKEGKVTGMPRELKGASEFFCPICTTCKSTRKSVKSNKRTKATRAFQVVSSDLMEVNVRSLMGRYKYAVIYVDHYTRNKYVYGITKKSDTWGTLEQFLREVVGPSGYSIETLMTDGGGEYQGEEWKYMMSKARKYQGIPIKEHRKSAPYNQASNGIAERAVGTLGNTARCLLKQANKPASWWYWALETAAYLHRMTLTKGNGGDTTPAQLLDNKVPDISHLKKWGSLVYMHVYDHKRKRFDDNSRPTYLVMYPDGYSSNTYTGYDPAANRTYESLHLTWDPRPGAPTTLGLDMKDTEDSIDMLWKYKDEEQFAHELLEVTDYSNSGRQHDEVKAQSTDHAQLPTQQHVQLPDDEGQHHCRDEGDAPHHTTASTGYSKVGDEDYNEDNNEGDDEGDDEKQDDNQERRRYNTRFQKKEREHKDRTVKALSQLSGVTKASDNSPGGRRILTEERIQQDISETRNLSHEPITDREALQIISGWNRIARQQFIKQASHECCRACKGVFTKNIKQEMQRGMHAHSDTSGAVKYQEGISCAVFNTLNIAIPKDRRQMLKTPNARQWLEAEKVEMDSMNIMQVYEPVKRSEVPNGANICKSRFVYDIKQDEHGRLSKYKVRWVAKGYSQRKGQDYWDTFSPVVRMSSIRTLIALATSNGWRKMEQLDIKTCFLEAELEKDTEIYVEPPEGYEKDLNIVYRLRKSLYGLKQSSRLWWLNLGTYLEGECSMKKTEYEDCIWQRTNKHTGKTVYLGAYVDDLVVTGDDEHGIEQITKALEARFRVTRLGQLKWILGCHLERDLRNGTASFKQTKYITDLVQQHGVQNLPYAKTPLMGGDKILSSWCPKENTDEYWYMHTFDHKTGNSRATTYRSIVGGLLWVARCTRPDIMFAVSQLCKYLNNPSKRHYDRAIRVLTYLNGTKDIGVTYGIRNHPCMYMERNEMIVYTDASFDDQENSKSTSGNITYLNYGPIAWSCQTQTDVAQSSCESEYIGLSKASNEAVFHSELLTDIGFRQGTVRINIDNTAAIELGKTQSTHQRTKHIRRRYHHVKSLVAEKVIWLAWMSGKYLPADALTKALPTDVFLFHRRNICGK